MARVGVNVVGIERDAKQFRVLTERVVTEAAFPAAALRQLDEDEAQPHVFRLLAAQFTKLNSDVASHFTEMQESSSETDDGDSEDGATAGEAVATDVLCPARGASVSPRAAAGCSKHQCPFRLCTQRAWRRAMLARRLSALNTVLGIMLSEGMMARLFFVYVCLLILMATRGLAMWKGACLQVQNP